MNARIIAWYIGISLLLVSALMLVAAVIAWFTPGDVSRVPLFCSALFAGAAGIYPLLFVRRGDHKLRFQEGNAIVVGSWFFACLFGMLPFLMYGGEFSFVDALFESVSGFTTTGASILNDIEALPRGLQFWRVSTAWVGGVGIVTLFSMIMRGSQEKSTLSGAEISSVARLPFQGQRSAGFANKLLITYVVLTIVTGLSLKLTGMGWFDAVTNAMSACSTCGFCTRNASIAFYANPAAEIVLTVAMLAAGANFGVLFLSFIPGSGRNLFKSETFRIFFFMVLGAICLVTFDLLVHGKYDALGPALRAASFQVASIATTTGFATQDTTTWPMLSMAVLLLCSLICGCSGSTSGGIKIDRAILAFKGVYNRVGTSIERGRVRVIRVDGHPRTPDQVNDALGFIFCYLVITAAMAGVNMAFGMDFTTGLTASVACIGNVGPGFGEVGSMANYADIPDFLKLTSLLEMLIGRLEIFPLLYFFRALRLRSSAPALRT
ncbi:MAG: TrkH family potassium uptake protein [Bacteroidales bacterium]|nr:TrkH family potassium uptake protein [Bacteroidales bacterium]